MASTKANIRLGGFKVYYGTLYLGFTSQDGITFNRNGNKYDVMSAISGMGIVKSFSQGETITADVELQEFDKNLLSQVLGAVNSFNVDSNDGTAGVITGGYSPGVEFTQKPLICYPTYVDENNQPYAADINNNFAFGLVAATPSSENEIVISPTQETVFPISFTGEYDLTRPEGQRVWFIGAVSAPADSIPTIS